MDMKFFKTVRFRITFINTIILIFVNLIVLFVGNILITDYYLNRDPVFDLVTVRSEIPGERSFFDENREKLEEILKDTLREAREKDLAAIRRISLYVFIFLAINSFIVSYVITEKILDPIRKITYTAKLINVNRLTKKIKNKNPDDEFGELINSFNSMIDRLNISFKQEKDLTSSIIHELKTPLAKMKSNLQTLSILNSNTQHDDKKYIDKSIKSINYINEIIDNLRLLHDVEVGKLHTESVTLYSFLNQIIKEYSTDGSVNLNKYKINYESKVGNHEVVRINKVLAKTAIKNLVENAIKHNLKFKLNHKKSLEIKISLYKDIVHGCEQYCITVKDNGKGISKQNQKKIFNKFFQISGQISSNKGLGIGLYLVKKIAILHKGDVFMSSKTGKGSKFTIHFPS